MSRNVALVLSSGGARGIAHIGVIEELIASGYTITSVAGASMGSLVGGMLAKGTLPEFTQWLLAFTKMDVIKLMDLAIGRGGLINMCSIKVVFYMQSGRRVLFQLFFFLFQ